MLETLLTMDNSLKTFFNQLTEAVGFGGYFGIIIAVEVLFVLIFGIKSYLSYEARLKRRLDKCNDWIFKNKKIDTNNIKSFNEIVKKGPKRFAYYWQQFILNRDGGPTAYMTEENIIEKPLRTSSWQSNVKSLSILTTVWAVISFLLGLASQANQSISFQAFAVSLVFPATVMIIGVASIIAIKGIRVLNLDNIYHLYHIFARFVTNACDVLPPYIDFNLLFTPKEIENGNAQIREYYEMMARKAKEEFEEAQKSEGGTLDYNFKDVGVDGALLLERAMKESEAYIATKSSTLSQIAQIDAQKEALRKNYEEVQMDLQRKLQASKENIEKLVEQQTTTTNRFEIGRLRERQDKEVKRQEQLQSDYNHEEAKFQNSKAELDKEIEKLSLVMVESLDHAEKGMNAEYQSFVKKVMKSAYAVADNKVKAEKKALEDDRDFIEQELINVQTQIKRLLDENVTLRSRLDEANATIAEAQAKADAEAAAKAEEEKPKGEYDEQGNFVYEDGSYHDTQGLFHDINGNIYDLNGSLIKEKDQREESEIKEEDLLREQAKRFGDIFDEGKKEDEIAEQDLKEVEKMLNHEVETLSEEVEAQPKEENAEAVVENEVKEEPVATVVEPVEEVKPEEPVQQEAQPEESIVDQTEVTEPKKKTTSKKTPAKKTTTKKSTDSGDATKKTSKPRKKATENKEVDIAKINELISEEEGKLDEIKNSLDNIDESIELNAVEKARESLIAEVESLKEQAKALESSENAGEELAELNKRIEDLINSIASLNGND